MSHCPCGSQKNYDDCCGEYLDKEQLPQTPEQLMRSRYTAYSQGKIDYIKNSMKGKALIGFNEQEAGKWAKSVTWLNLEVIQSRMASVNVGYVEFIARFSDQNQEKFIHELSEFHKIDDQWFYVSGEHKNGIKKIKKPVPARNAPCPCGSGKKFKNCHAK